MIPYGVAIYVALEPVDMRLGFDRLGGLVRERMEMMPRSKALFVFHARNRQSLKVLFWDGSGMVLCHKRLDHGVFEIPRSSRTGERSVVVTNAVFEAMFGGFQTSFH